MVVPTHGVPEGVFDDDGRVVPDAQLQIQDAIAAVRLAERAVAGSRLVPSAVLAESSIDRRLGTIGAPQRGQRGTSSLGTRWSFWRPAISRTCRSLSYVSPEQLRAHWSRP